MNNFIGKKALDFTVPAVLSNGSIVKDFNFYNFTENKRVLLFFYPMDFTFVCPSELISINNRIENFNSRNIDVIGMSVDSCYTHKAWRDTPIDKGGLGNSFNFILASDIKKDVGNYYGIIDEVSGVSYRASFIIDENKFVRVQHLNDFPIGRNIDEYIRLFDALDFHKNYGYVCQAGWSKGDVGIKPTSNGITNFLKEKHEKL